MNYNCDRDKLFLKIFNMINSYVVKLTSVSLILFTLVGCAPNQAGLTNKTAVGTVGGALIGGLAGSAFGSGSGKAAAIVVGSALGALAGNSIGSSLDRADLAYQQRSYNYALENNQSGSSSAWKNPDNGHQGSITPVKTYTSNGHYCREFIQTASIGGRTQEIVGQACRNPDGSWTPTN